MGSIFEDYESYLGKKKSKLYGIEEMISGNTLNYENILNYENNSNYIIGIEYEFFSQTKSNSSWVTSVT